MRPDIVRIVNNYMLQKVYMIVISTQGMDDQTEIEKVRVAIRQTRSTREHDRVVAVYMVRIKGYAVQAAADIL